MTTEPTSFQQFFHSSPQPPQLFNATPKSNSKYQRSYSNNSKLSRENTSPYSSLRDTKRKSYSLLKTPLSSDQKNVKIYLRFRPLNAQESVTQNIFSKSIQAHQVGQVYVHRRRQIALCRGHQAAILF